MAKQVLIRVDRSRYEAALNCPRDRWWSYEHPTGQVSQGGGGEDESRSINGIVRNSVNLHFAIGSGLHAGVQTLLMGDSTEGAMGAADAALSTIRPEQVALEAGEDDTNTRGAARGTGTAAGPDAVHRLAEARGLVRGLTAAYARVRLPAILREYRCIAVEQEVKCVLYDGEDYKVELLGRPDIFLERLSDGALIIDELKTVGSIRMGWRESWERDLQVHLQTLEARQWLADRGDTRRVAGIMVEGFIKGQRKKDKETGIKMYSSPLTYAYHRQGDGITPDSIQTSWKWGHRKALLAQLGLTTGDWVNRWLDEATVQAQIAVVPFIQPSDWLTESAVRQMVSHEIRLRQAREAVLIESDEGDARAYWLDHHFPQRTKACYQFGHPCDKLAACFTANVTADPIASGLYVARTANHPTEVGESD